MSELGRWLILAGLLLMVVGALFLLAAKLPWLGKLPGDIVIKRDKFTFYLPLGTSILISIVLTLILYLFRR